MTTRVRGRIITPLKDRFGSQIRTHYPLTVELEQRIMLAEATPPVVGDSGVTVEVPEHLMRMVAEFSHIWLVRATTCESAERCECSPQRCELRGARGERAASRVAQRRV